MNTKNIQFDAIERVNYWSRIPITNGYSRKQYINVIQNYLGNSLVKVLVGQRRAGKSTLLKQIIQQLRSNGTPANNILYLNFESHELQWIKTHTTLIEIIELYLHKKKPAHKIYIMLDEIQEIDQWEKAINGYLASDQHDIEFLLTGSNANLLSTELSTYITGRYIEISVFPFSFHEYLDYQKLSPSKETLISYLDSSGLPELFFLTEHHQKRAYFSALKDSILMNDVAKRFNIRNPKLLILLLDFLIDNTGKLFSTEAIFKKLKSTGLQINAITLNNYIHYIELTFLIHSARRFDIKGKKILEGERKYYLNDLGFSNYLQNTFDNNITRRLENFVYLALIQAGYQVYIGNIYQLEVDFIAEKNQEKIYIQVTYLLHSDEVIAREYGNLEKIKDNWPKWVVSMDDVTFPANKGILHVKAWDFLSRLV